MANENTPTTSSQESPKPAPGGQPESKPGEAKPDQSGSPAKTEAPTRN